MRIWAKHNGNSSDPTRRHRWTAGILRRRCTPTARSLGASSTFAVLSSPSVCLSIALTNPLCRGEIHTSCLTAHRRVYPGRSVLCNLKPVLNAQPCLYTERRLRREGERERQSGEHSQKTTGGDWVNCGVHHIDCIYLWLARRTPGLIRHGINHWYAILMTVQGDWLVHSCPLHGATKLCGKIYIYLMDCDATHMQRFPATDIQPGSKNAQALHQPTTEFYQFHTLS